MMMSNHTTTTITSPPSSSSGKDDTGRDMALSSSRHGLSSSRHGSTTSGKGLSGDMLSSSRHGGDSSNAAGGGGVTKNWGLLRNTVRAISGSTAQKEHGGMDTLGTSRHGGDKDALSSSRHGNKNNEENEATVAMAGGVGATKKWGLLRNTVRASGLGTSRHGVDKDALSSSRRGNKDEENEATVAMAALFTAKSGVGKDVSTASSTSSSLTKTSSFLLKTGFIPVEEENEAIVALSRQSSTRSRNSSLVSQPDFAEGDERSPKGKSQKLMDDNNNNSTTSVDSGLKGGEGTTSNDGTMMEMNPSEEEETEQMKNERLTKKINDLLRKK